MKNLLKLLHLILFSFVISIGVYSEEMNDKIYVNAVVRWQGSFEADGCEWMLYINGMLYKASNLPEKYAVDSLEIRLIYAEDLEYKYFCGDNPIPKQAIRIIEIEENYTGLSNLFDSGKITIYPNPVSETFQLSGLDGTADVSLFDLSGRTVLVQKKVSDKTLIQINHLSQGVYIIRIHTPQEIIERKILKK